MNSTPPTKSKFLPPRVLTWYLTREFLGFFLPILAGFVLLYVIVDVFERLDILLKNGATLSASARYFIFKMPLMVTQVLPPAVVLSVLFAYGMASRRNEITALRAGGVSLLQTGMPILYCAAAISLAALVWNETVVPYCTRYYQQVNLLEIRKRDRRSLLSDREIWYHGEQGFYNIEHVDAKRQALFGVVIYQINPDFSLRRVIQIPRLNWQESGWTVPTAIEHVVPADGRILSRTLETHDITIPERLEDFLEVQQEPEELGYLALRDRINQLIRKGIDASNLTVDLNLKLAIPFSSFVLAAIAVPIAGRVRRHPSLAAIVSTGAVTGFGYWVLLGLTNSLGQSGVLAAPLAAWAANLTYAMLALILFLRAE